jgi:hypothetical protein
MADCRHQLAACTGFQRQDTMKSALHLPGFTLFALDSLTCTLNGRYTLLAVFTG